MVSFTIKAPSLSRLRERYRQAPSLAAQQMDRGLRTSAAITLLEVAARTPRRTGRLRKGWGLRWSKTGALREVALVNTVPYAGYVERGTRRHIIRARFRKALRWEQAGEVRFAKSVHHPGTKARRMLKEGAAAAHPRVVRIMAAHLGIVNRHLIGR